MNIQDTRPIRDGGNYDVIVAGGGVAGVAAAVSAARAGARTMLIEKGIYLGGLATSGLINLYEPLCDGKGRRVQTGMAEELLWLSMRYGPDNMREGWKKAQDVGPSPERYCTRFSPTLFALALDDFVLESGVRVRFETKVVFPVMEGKCCTGLVTESKSGREYFGAKVVIDATGDAELFYLAGAPTCEGENYLVYVMHAAYLEQAKAYVEKSDAHFLRKTFWFGGSLDSKELHKTPIYHGTDADEITRFVLAGRKMAFERIKTEPRSERDVLALPSMPQFRTIRRIIGGYELTGSDQGEKLPRSVGQVADFRKVGAVYDLPYDCLYVPGYDNMLAAGRIISASGDGWEVTRVIPVCVLTGQAAGLAAAYCVQNEEPVTGVDVNKLRKEISQSYKKQVN